jgi:hypothetical protein
MFASWEGVTGVSVGDIDACDPSATGTSGRKTRNGVHVWATRVAEQGGNPTAIRCLARRGARIQPIYLSGDLAKIAVRLEREGFGSLGIEIEIEVPAAA